MSESSLHPLTHALGLALPPDAVVRTAPQAVAAEHPTQDWRLTAFQRPATAGASAAQLHAAVVGSLAKRNPEAVPSPAVTVSGPGWQGLRAELGIAGGRTLRVLTVLDTEAALLVGVVLDVAAGVTVQPEAWLRSTAAPAPAPTPAKPTLSLAPLEGEAPAPARPALSLAPLEGETAAAAAPPAPRASFSLAPIESEAPPAAAAPEPAAGRARFGAREPTAGPVASNLTPAAAVPPAMPAANPYQPPDTVALETDPDAEADPEALRAAGRGQRILIWCVLLNFAARGLYRNPEIPVLLNWTIAVALMVWAFHGVLLIASGFGYGRGTKLGLLFGSTVPLLGIGLWIWLSMKTTRMLKAAGHTVGFFGVKS